jgi:hypothetical protein
VQKIWFTMLASTLVILIGSSKSEATPSAKKMSIIGCWDRIYNKPFDRWPPTQNTLCFGRQNKLQGWTADDGDGWDYSGTWRYAGIDSISIRFPDADEPRRGTCSFWIDEVRRVLVFTRCEILHWNGAWQRDLSMERIVRP